MQTVLNYVLRSTLTIHGAAITFIPFDPELKMLPQSLDLCSGASFVCVTVCVCRVDMSVFALSAGQLRRVIKCGVPGGLPATGQKT